MKTYQELKKDVEGEMRVDKKTVQKILRIHDNSCVGDIADINYIPKNEYDDYIERIARAGYITLAGDRYILTPKALWI